MIHHYTSEQVRMLVRRGERELAGAIEASQRDGDGVHVALVAQASVHEAVVSLTKLFRDQVPGATEVATAIARAYAKGADARAGAPRRDCVHVIVALVREGRERYLPDGADAASDLSAVPRTKAGACGSSENE
jgi:hypothetical protein